MLRAAPRAFSELRCTLWSPVGAGTGSTAAARARFERRQGAGTARARGQPGSVGPGGCSRRGGGRGVGQACARSRHFGHWLGCSPQGPREAGYYPPGATTSPPGCFLDLDFVHVSIDSYACSSWQPHNPPAVRL